MSMTAFERFERWVEPEPMSGCWLWLGARDSSGYGQLWVNGRVVGAHRFAYETFIGPIAAGLHLDHGCRNHSCVNPGHVEPVTVLENLMRGIPGQWVARSHCPSGHPFNTANTYRNPASRGRTCRACRDAYMRVYNRRYYAEHPEKWRKFS